MSTPAAVVRGDAVALPFRDESVDLIVTSPPYFALRSYKDGGEHYDGQIGSEPHPRAFLEALWAVMAECWRVLKPSGSVFVNLGDKRAGSGGGAPQTVFGKPVAGIGPKNYAGQSAATRFGRSKSRMMLPERFAIGCMDGLADPEGIGWIVRQIIVWEKPNGIPESVRDRTRDNYELWFHLTKQGDYYAAVDEIREPHKPESIVRAAAGRAGDRRAQHGANAGHLRVEEGWGQGYDVNPLGKLPGSVWRIPTEPLRVPEWLGVDHFAAFPTEWPRRLILGWSPPGWCQACGEARRPVLDTRYEEIHRHSRNRPVRSDLKRSGFGADGSMNGRGVSSVGRNVATITGYACACPDTSAPTRPAVVLDPFGGTGTTAMVARALGRTGISLDLSADYCRLAKWRIFESGHGAKAVERTNRDRQGVLL